MTAPANTATTLSQRGNREQLTEIMERIAPEETPFTSNIGNVMNATATYVEWQLEDLAPPNGDGVLEGATTTAYEQNVTVRVGNHTQIRSRSYSVSATQEAVNKAGRQSEITRHRRIKSIEVKRDFELVFLRNGASRPESGANSRLSAGMCAWLTTNVSRGTGGANGGFGAGNIVSAATNGTQRPFTEALLRNVMQLIFTNSGNRQRRYIYMSPFHKQQFSGFPGIAANRNEMSGQRQATIIGAAEVYMSDYGPLVAVPVAYGLSRDVLIVDHEYAGVATLRPMTEEKLAKIGDSEQRLIVAEKTLVVKNEKAHGVIADLTTS